jgi:hypothetical protein
MSSTFFYNSQSLVGVGAIGIGTTSPTSQLHVYSLSGVQNQTGQGVAQIVNCGGLPLNINYTGAGGSLNYAIYSVSGSSVGTTNTKFFRYIGSVLSDGNNGNLGGLHIEGIIGGGFVGGNACYLKADFTNRGTSGGYKYSQLTGGTVDSTMNIFMVSNTSSTNYDLYIQYGNSGYNGFNLDIKSTWATFNFINIEGTADPRTAPTSYATSWDLLGTANFVQKGSNGNVGIGTASPNTTLDVNGILTTRSDIYTTPASTTLYSNTFIVRWNDSTAGIVGTPKIIINSNGINSGSPQTLVMGVDGTGFAQTAYLDTQTGGVSATTPLAFRMNGTEYMRVHTNGNVGIGTTNPGAQLTLTSNLYAGGMIQSASAAGGITNQGAYMTWNLSGARGETDFINQQGLGSGGWNWYNYNSSNQLTANAAYLSSTGALTLGTYSNAYTAPSGGLICPGNVGIGTTNPTSALQVAGDVVCAGTLSAGNPLMFRNALYNGDMRISQRGTSFTNPSSQYTLDRWYISIYGSTGNGTVSQIQSGLANFSNAFQLATTSTTAGNWYISQSLETRDVVRFQGQAVTVSFWYRIPTNFTQVWTPYLFWTTSIDTAITNSSSPAPNTAGSGTMPNTTAWTYTSFQASVPVSAEALSVMFVTFLNVVNGATIQITGVQLEKGSVATPYEILPYATELALCQRYYQKSYQQGDYAGTVTSTNGIIAVSAVNVDSIAGTRFNVPMRATPGTTTIYSTAGTAGKATVFNGGADTSAITTTYATNVGIGYLYINAANLTQGNGYRYHYVADADL